ncbi:hypothetical protein GMLC_14840 [Geomonas limicola]|uniref:Uncharacterized protein n=1 Tax=Geomonas limicola TaxID=2740186 RepID=A0A6V8N5Q9_9BACT|nr:hypothetical protein [Geomonas limicola]GFO67905.1 hypothetical protein GMLC_14840 [Geomonas limicola]
MKFFLTTAGAVALCVLGQTLVGWNWSVEDQFFGGYATAFIVSAYLKMADTL